MTRQQDPAYEDGMDSPAVANAASKGMLRRIAIASGTGTLIEYYDFVIFAAVTALVFPTAFYPALGAAAGTVASFATLGVAFVARPFGSILFGHFGDRLGRKKTLISTMLLMGAATLLVGVLPTAAQIGVAAPIVLIVLRVVQGLAVGGEWTGATLMGAENAPKGRRGFWSMFASLGGVIGATLAFATLWAASVAFSDEAFVAYGWRIPFLASALLLGIGLYIRASIDETPVFKAEVARSGTAKAPFVDALRQQPREMVFGSGVLVMIFAFYYLVIGYLINYGTATLGLSSSTVLAISVLAGVVFAASLVLGGAVSDRIGRRNLLLVANAVAVVWSLMLFPILDGASAVTYATGSCVTAFIAGVAYGPIGAFMPELFHTRYRYTAAGFSYNVAGVLGGAVPPIVGAAITASYGGFAFGLFISALCLLSLGCTFALRETSDYDMDRSAAVAPA